MLKAFDDAGKELPEPLKKNFERLRAAREQREAGTPGQ
jgi:Flp pilus assembly protein TadB